LGLLHADVGVPESPSCPVRRSEFDRTEVPLWLLGHVHLPDPELLTGELPAVGYVGSPQGIDPGPGERGFHGPLLLDIGATRTRVQRMAVGGVRYEELEISLEGVADEGSLQQRLAADLSAAAARMKEEQPSLAVVSLRLTVSGRCALPTPDIDRQAAQLMETGMEASGVRLHVTRCTVRRLPMLDAEVLAQGRGLVAELARTALALESDDLPVGATAQLLAEVVDRLRDVDGSGAFAGLDHGSLDRPLDEPAIRALAARQAWRLLDALVCQGQTGGDA
jgi:exonuclease SbcD